MTPHRLMLLCSLFALGLSGCTVSQQVMLSDIKPTRFYRTDKSSLYDQVRIFCKKEEYRLERIEMESGAIIGHKRVTVSAETGSATGTGSTRQIILNMKVRPAGVGELEVTTRFTFADYSGTLSRDDEGMLVSQYLALFDMLDGAFAGK